MNQAQKTHARLQGPVVPLNICFNDDGTVNFDAVANYVDWLCRQNTPVILLTYGSSEFAWMTDDDLWELTARVGKAVDGRSLYIASTGFWLPRQTLEFLEHADASGADAVKVQVSGWDGPSAPIVEAYFDALANTSTDIPLLMWWNAMHWCTSLPSDLLETFCKLAKRPNIIGIKNDGDPFYDYKKLIRGTVNDNCAVLSGGLMQNFLFGHPLGSPAYLCPIAPFRPDIAIRFHAHVLAGELEQAQQIIYQYEDPIMEISAEVNWLVLMKTSIMILGFYPNNRVGNPSNKSATGDELQRIRDFYSDLFQLGSR